MRILLWHVHGSWMTAFVQGRHDYVVPVVPDRGPDGLGRARTWNWPTSVVERSPEQLLDEDIDLVLLQRPCELDLAERWLGRRPGIDVPAVYLEHNTPDGSPCGQRHLLADRDDIRLVHVTFFNELFWDNGNAPTSVIEHGVVDPGYRYTGEIAAAAVVSNQMGRRGRVVGADLVPRFAEVAPVDVFGMQAEAFAASVRPHDLGTRFPVTGYQRLTTQDEMHSEAARRRVYLHPVRWTSLGLSLIEAMLLGMPVVALATTEVVEAVPPSAGVVSTDPVRLTTAVRSYLEDAEVARKAGIAARSAALNRYGLARFLADWDSLLARSIAERRVAAR